MFKLAAIEQMAYSATGLAFFGGRPRGRRGRLGLSLSALTSSDSASVVASVGATVSSAAAFALLAAFDGYTDPEKNKSVIWKDVFKKGDSYFNTGDL
ncbi:hypothetical protein IAF45_05930, partial [Acinetobacter baumannii]|nr:hypothetical protein [Acinetobacter baumannii]